MQLLFLRAEPKILKRAGFVDKLTIEVTFEIYGLSVKQESVLDTLMKPVEGLEEKRFYIDPLVDRRYISKPTPPPPDKGKHLLVISLDKPIGPVNTFFTLPFDIKSALSELRKFIIDLSEDIPCGISKP